MKLIKYYILFIIFFLIPFNCLALKIVSLSPSITEIIFELGAGNTIVGNTTYCNYPEEAKKITKIGSYAKPSVEKILSLKPDIVIGMKGGLDKSLKTKLNELKIKSIFYDSKNIDDIKNIIKDIAVLTNTKPDKLLNKINDLFNNYPKQKVTGIFLVNVSPIIAVGKNSFVNEIMKCAGVKNIVNTKKSYPLINKEFIITQKPNVIILSYINNKNTLEIKKMLKTFLPDTRLIKVNSDIYNRPSYRIADACMDLRKKIKALK